MVQTRSRAQSGARLTRAKSIWKPNPTNSAQETTCTSEKRRGLDEECTEDVQTEERGSIGNKQGVEDKHGVATSKEPQTGTLVGTVEANGQVIEGSIESTSYGTFSHSGSSEQESEPESSEFAAQDILNDTLSSAQDFESESAESDAVGLLKEKKVICFNDKGQPIGEGSAPFTSELGSITRKHCPISYKTWHNVPSQTRDNLWKLVTDKYVIPVVYKSRVLERMYYSWKKFKYQLRTKYYDIYNTDEERKRHQPKGVTQDVWNKFVDNQSTPAAQALRIAGKIARQAMKTPHVSGRSGAARVAEALKQRNPSGTVTRTEVYLALHTRADGSCPTPELTEKVEKIKAMAAENPSSINSDIYHDPVAQVFGPERSGRSVRGMGAGVSKTSLRHSAPATHLLEQERALRIAAEKQLADLREKGVSPELAETHSSGIPWFPNTKASLRHSAPARHHLQQERALRIAAEKQLADLREKVVAPEPVETHTSGTCWFQNTPILRKRKSITETTKLVHETSPGSKKRKGFEDNDVEMDYEEKGF